MICSNVKFCHDCEMVKVFDCEKDSGELVIEGAVLFFGSRQHFAKEAQPPPLGFVTRLLLLQQGSHSEVRSVRVVALHGGGGEGMIDQHLLRHSGPQTGRFYCTSQVFHCTVFHVN